MIAEQITSEDGVFSYLRDNLSGAIEDAHGDAHVHWEDYTESFSLVVKNKGQPMAAATLLYDEELSNRHGSPMAFLANFQARNSVDAVRVLATEFKAWAAERHIDRLRGPMTPFIGDERGILIDGFKYGPCIGFPFSPPFYKSLFEGSGFTVAMDMYSYRFTLAQSKWYQRVARFARARLKNVQVYSLSDMDKTDAFERVAKIYNDSWSESWMFFPLEARGLLRLYEALSPILIPELNFIVSVDGVDAGVFMSAPNVLSMNSSGTPSSYRGMLFGVLPGYRRRGVDALLASVAFERATAIGYKLFDIGWILQSNASWLRQAAKFAGGSEDRRTFRIYDLAL